jgi:UrcA family protein
MINRQFGIRGIANACLLTLGAALGAGAAGPAAALPVPSVAISYADLDLSKLPDVQRLFERLRRAAATVCPADSGITDLSRRAVRERCYRDALRRAVAQVKGSDLLLSVYHDFERREYGPG